MNGDIEKAPTTEECIREFMKQFRMLQNELDNVKEQQKELVESYEDRLDTKTLKKAMRAAKIKASVQALDTFEEYCEVLDTEVI